MKNILFPKHPDNNYKGHKLAMWVLCLYVFRSFLAGFIHMFASDGGAQSIASINLDMFSDGASDTIITMFAMWGMEQFVIALIILVILINYKSLIPAAWLIYAIEFTGRWLIPMFKPGVQSTHTPPGHVIDYIFVPLSILMFIFALYTSQKRSKLTE